MKSFQQIFSAACHERDHEWALATLVRTQGSTYRQAGARLLVAPDATTIGVLSGGCLEEKVARHGMEVMANGEARLVAFDTRKLYGCEGKLEIYIERIEAAGTGGNFLTEVAERISRRAMCRTRTAYAEGGGSELLPDKALVIERLGVFVQAVPLPIRLLLFGNGPEIAPLKLLAAGMGWSVNDYVHPDELPLDFIADAATAAVVMTHKFGRDLTALDRLLPLGLNYLGLLGPKRRRGELLAEFQNFRELDGEWLEALHSPAGLDIGSESPEEIALSIVSEVAAVLAGRRGGMLRDRAMPIHEVEVLDREA
jgi:xanthine/CO dehydrogenase XdhC/CoxF family maturation factor